MIVGLVSINVIDLPMIWVNPMKCLCNKAMDIEVKPLASELALNPEITSANAARP